MQATRTNHREAQVAVKDQVAQLIRSLGDERLQGFADRVYDVELGLAPTPYDGWTDYASSLRIVNVQGAMSLRARIVKLLAPWSVEN